MQVLADIITFQAFPHFLQEIADILKGMKEAMFEKKTNKKQLFAEISSYFLPYISPFRKDDIFYEITFCVHIKPQLIIIHKKISIWEKKLWD